MHVQVAESSWKQQRQQVLARVERLMDILKGASEVSSAAQLGFISSTNEIEKAKTHVVLIDDNMFYHSMRREYMRVARPVVPSLSEHRGTLNTPPEILLFPYPPSLIPMRQ